MPIAGAIDFNLQKTRPTALEARQMLAKKARQKRHKSAFIKTIANVASLIKGQRLFMSKGLGASWRINTGIAKTVNPVLCNRKRVGYLTVMALQSD